MILTLAMALALSSPLDDPIPGHEEERALAREVIAVYEDHPSGSRVYDYFVCHYFYQQGQNILFPPSDPDLRYPSPFDLWDIETPLSGYSRTGPSAGFWENVQGLIFTDVLVRFDEIGYDRCLRFLRSEERTWEEIFELQEQRRQD